MEITKMTQEDCHALAELDKICFAVPWSEKSFSDEAENPLATYYVAREDGKIIGYGGVWLVGDEGQITNIAVLPEFRKSGVASRILEKLLDRAKDCYQVVLEVRESNLPAISLYSKYGFINAGLRKNFYHSPTENAIVMIRSRN